MPPGRTATRTSPGSGSGATWSTRFSGPRGEKTCVERNVATMCLPDQLGDGASHKVGQRCLAVCWAGNRCERRRSISSVPLYGTAVRDGAGFLRRGLALIRRGGGDAGGGVEGVEFTGDVGPDRLVDDLGDALGGDFLYPAADVVGG